MRIPATAQSPSLSDLDSSKMPAPLRRLDRPSLAGPRSSA